MSTLESVRAAARARRQAAIRQVRQEGRELTPDALISAAIAAEGLRVIPCNPGSSLLEGNRAAIDRERRRIAIDNSLTDEQRRFSLAHELGHDVLEGPAAECAGELDETGSLPFVGEALVTGYSPHQPHEAQASTFASEFLAPADELDAAFERGTAATSLAAEYGVSRTVVHGQLIAALLLPRSSEQGNPVTPPSDYHPKQVDAFQTGDGAHCVDAGPGTGKTRTLIARVQHLIDDRGIPPERVLCLTFSNKAAREMQERLEQALGTRARLVRVRTFHAFGLDLLRDYPDQAGVANDVTLLDTAEICELLERNLSELGLEAYRHVSAPGLYLEAIVKAISRAKDEMVSPQRYVELAAEMLARVPDGDDRADKKARRAVEVGRVYEVYERLLEQHGIADYGDLIYRVVRMLEADREVAEEVAERWPHVLVDEYQDVNRASARLLELIHQRGQSLWVVGDVRQAIYGFRGAASDNLRRFREEFDGAGDPLPLVRNYRSAPALLDLFSSVATAMKDSEGFADWEAERRDVQGVATLATATCEEAELTGIADAILADERRPIPFTDYSVLCHRNQDVQLVAEYLASRGIPVANFGNYMERDEVRDLLALLSMHAEYGATALPRIGGMEPHTLSAADLDALLDAAISAEGGLPAVMRGGAPEGMETGAFARFREDWEALSAVTFQEEVWTFYAEYLFEDGRYLRGLLRERSPQSEQRLLAIGQLVLLARTFDARQAAVTDEPTRGIERKRDFLRFVRRLWTLRDGRLPIPAADGEAVYVGTVHSSKGLEFPVVFVPFLVEGRFPFNPPRDDAPPPANMVSEDADAAERELEALFFVAMTRAKDRLYLSRAESYGGSKPPNPSRLLTLLDQARSRQLIAEARWSRVEIMPASGETRLRRTFPRREFRYAELDSYATCPRRFYYRHVLNLPEPEDGRAFLAYRTATAATLDWLDEQHRTAGLPNSWDAVATVLAENWYKHGPGGHIHESFYRTEAEAYIRRIWAELLGRSPLPSYGSVVAGEIDGVRFAVPVQATQVTEDEVRICHRYYRDPKATEDHLELRFPLIRHALAAAVPRKRVVIEAVYPRTSVPFAPLRRDAEGRRIDAYRAAVAGIAAGTFPPAPADGAARECPRCPFAFICPW